MAVDKDGKVVIGGDFTSVPAFNRWYIARLNADGVLDGQFDPSTVIGGTAPVLHSVVVDQNSRVYMAGQFTTANGNNLARLNEVNGGLDANFRPGPTTQVSQLGADNTIRSLTMDSYGLLLLGGDFSTYKVPGQDSENNPQPLSRGPHVARVGGL